MVIDTGKNNTFIRQPRPNEQHEWLKYPSVTLLNLILFWFANNSIIKKSKNHPYILHHKKKKRKKKHTLVTSCSPFNKLDDDIILINKFIQVPVLNASHIILEHAIALIKLKDAHSTCCSWANHSSEILTLSKKNNNNSLFLYNIDITSFS